MYAACLASTIQASDLAMLGRKVSLTLCVVIVERSSLFGCSSYEVEAMKVMGMALCV